MPYEILGKVGLSSGIMIVMAVLIYEWIKNTKALNDDHKQFVEKVMDESKNRESNLIEQLNKYNCALENNNKILDKISNKLNVIPKLQDDVKDIKEHLDIK